MRVTDPLNSHNLQTTIIACAADQDAVLLQVSVSVSVCVCVCVFFLFVFLEVENMNLKLGASSPCKVVFLV